jgi:hypothetical protein
MIRRRKWSRQRRGKKEIIEKELVGNRIDSGKPQHEIVTYGPSVVK